MKKLLIKLLVRLGIVKPARIMTDVEFIRAIARATQGEGE